jgi:polypeptide N-acetylgalactosaminyltransferase
MSSTKSEGLVMQVSATDAAADTRVPPVASVIIVSHNEGDRLRDTVRAIVETTPASVEIIVVDDDSTDGSTGFLLQERPARTLVRPPRRLGVASARNYGVRAARGAVLIFSDAHVEPLPGWFEPLYGTIVEAGAAAAAPAVRPMGSGGAPGYGFTWLHPSLTTAWLRQRPETTVPVPFLCGCFFAVSRLAFEQTGGFDDGLVKWGLEDAELSLRLWRQGHSCVVTPDAEIRHLFRPRFPYQVDWQTTLHNVIRVAIVHFGERALERVINEFAGNPALPSVLARIVDSDVWSRRAAVDALCSHDDAWFFARFGMDVMQ